MTGSSNKPLPIDEEPTLDASAARDPNPKSTGSGGAGSGSTRSGSRPSGTPKDVVETPTRDTLIGDDDLPIDESYDAVQNREQSKQNRENDGASDSSDFELSEGQYDRSYEAPEKVGDYEIRDLIGSGGMGNVYLAEHVRMQRMVAIKMLPIERMQNDEAIQRFYAEVRAASRLLHPNIVAAFDAGEVEIPNFGLVHFMAMEYVEGLTLTQTIAQTGPMSIGEAASTIRQAAIGLLHAHRAGIIHRDVKPGNLMRASDGTIKVLDLGLARIHSASISSQDHSAGSDDDDDSNSKERGRLVGTLPFMSPEQLEDPDSVDARSDIYSLGATMYFLLTANPPFTGEYLDQVYGHRHGEIPNLMEARDDVDLNFANLFERMMAKSPGQRYQSLDEVIDDLTEYASQEDTPNWLAEFSNRQTQFDASTVSGGSTSGTTTRVFGVDFGMMYAAAAHAAPDGSITTLSAGMRQRKLFRLAIASHQKQLVFDDEAIAMRSTHPQSVVHCLQMYLGKQEVARDIAGRHCPPEVLLAIVLRKIFETSWKDGTQPHATAITVPASYDQLHRQCIMQAAQMAGFASIRLVDRSIAAVQSLWSSTDDAGDDLKAADGSLSSLSLQTSVSTNETSRNVIFLGLTGQATEVAVVRRSGARLHQLATTGHWHGGTLPWLHRLVDLASSVFVKQHGLDPKDTIGSAAQLQIACEKAMNGMIIMPTARIELEMHGRKIAIELERDEWIESCKDLIATIRQHVIDCFHQASIAPGKIDTCVTLGAILRMPTIRDQILPDLDESVTIRAIDRSDVARGAAACLASELPGRTESARGDLTMPPRILTSHTIGILIEDAKGRRRILPIIPKGTLLPARTNRRLSAGKDSKTMKVSLVESSGVDGKNWHTLGRYDLDVSGDDVSNKSAKKSRTISFEINVNGLLTVRAPMPVANHATTSSDAAPVLTSTKLPPLPTSHLDEASLAEWKGWIETIESLNG